VIFQPAIVPPVAVIEPVKLPEVAVIVPEMSADVAVIAPVFETVKFVDVIAFVPVFTRAAPNGLTAVSATVALVPTVYENFVSVGAGLARIVKDAPSKGAPTLVTLTMFPAEYPCVVVVVRVAVVPDCALKETSLRFPVPNLPSITSAPDFMKEASIPAVEIRPAVMLLATISDEPTALTHVDPSDLLRPGGVPPRW
jgi:hypothetical protein